MSTRKERSHVRDGLPSLSVQDARALGVGQALLATTRLSPAPIATTPCGGEAQPRRSEEMVRERRRRPLEGYGSRRVVG